MSNSSVRRALRAVTQVATAASLVAFAATAAHAQNPVTKEQPAALLPVFCGKPGDPTAPDHAGTGSRPVNIIIGKPLPPQSPGKVIRSEIDSLRIQLEQMENQGIVAATLMLH